MKHVIRTSDRIAFKRCRRAWDLGSILRQNYVPTAGRKPLEFGTAWHAALEVYYRAETWELVRSGDPTTRSAIEAATLARFGAVCLEQRTKYVDDNGDLPVEAEQDFKERLELGRGMLQGYFIYALKNDNFKVIAREVDFEVPITSGETWLTSDQGPVVYQGRIDGVIQDQYGSYWIWEDKTTSQFSDANLELDEQTGSYAWAVSQELGIPIKGVIYNEALKAVPTAPTRLQRQREGRNFSVNKKIRTTPEAFTLYLTEQGEPLGPYAEFIAELEANPNPFFRRTPVIRNQHELREMGERIYLEAQDMTDPNLRIYPNPSRFTCGWCAFKQVCIAMNDGSDYEHLLEWDFRKRSDEEVEQRRARV